MKSNELAKPQKDIQLEIMLRDSEAAKYDDWYIKTKGLWWHETELKVLLPLLQLTQDDTLLDAGCGTGRISIEAAPYVQDLYGVDFSPVSIKMLLKRSANIGLSNITAQVGDITQLTFKSDTFDKAISVQVIEHIPSLELRLQALREILRVLKQGGRFIFTVYRWGGMITQNKEGYWDNGLYRYAFTAEESYELMRKVGYVDIDVMRLINVPALRRFGRWTSSIERWLSIHRINIGKGIYLCVVGHKPIETNM